MKGKGPGCDTVERAKRRLIHYRPEPPSLCMPVGTLVFPLLWDKLVSPLAQHLTVFVGILDESIGLSFFEFQLWFLVPTAFSQSAWLLFFSPHISRSFLSFFLKCTQFFFEKIRNHAVRTFHLSICLGSIL